MGELQTASQFLVKKGIYKSRTPDTIGLHFRVLFPNITVPGKLNTKKVSKQETNTDKCVNSATFYPEDEKPFELSAITENYFSAECSPLPRLVSHSGHQFNINTI